MNILIKRWGAMGDTILLTPIVRKLSKDNTNSKIDVSTAFGEVFLNNPYVNRVLPYNKISGKYDRIIDLDGVYESNPSIHIVDAFGLKVFNTIDFDKSTELFPSEVDKHFFSHCDKDVTDVIVVHAGNTGALNRTWPYEYWVELIEQLIKGGKKVILVGSNKDFKISCHNVLNLTGLLTIQQIGLLISKAHCFVGSDTGLFHVAGTTNKPIVGIFTSAKSEFRVPFRDKDCVCEILHPDLDCYGCVHSTPPTTYNGCHREDYKCLYEIKPEMVYNKIINI